jgi:hypothetical protein
MNYIISRLIAVSKKTGIVFKTGFKLFRKSKKEIIIRNSSGKIIKKPSNLPPEIPGLDKGLLYSANFKYTQSDCGTKLRKRNNAGETSVTNYSIRYHLLTIPLGVSVIKDFFSKSITSKVSKK